MKDLTFHRETIAGVNVLLPNLTLDKEAEDSRPLGRWGLERQNYLGEMNLYGLYLMRGNLFKHLREIDQQAEQMEEQLKASLMEQEIVPDRQKHPLRWAQYNLNLQSRVDEIIRAELIQV